MMQVPFVKFLLAPGKSKEASESLSFGRVLSLSFRAQREISISAPLCSI